MDLPQVFKKKILNVVESAIQEAPKNEATFTMTDFFDEEHFPVQSMKYGRIIEYAYLDERVWEAICLFISTITIKEKLIQFSPHHNIDPLPLRYGFYDTIHVQW